MTEPGEKKMARSGIFAFRILHTINLAQHLQREDFVSIFFFCVGQACQPDSCEGS
jgi:hypothetical protein